MSFARGAECARHKRAKMNKWPVIFEHEVEMQAQYALATADETRTTDGYVTDFKRNWCGSACPPSEWGTWTKP